MTELTLPNILSLAVLMALLAIKFLTPKAPFRWHRWLGASALLLGGAAFCVMGTAGALSLWHGAGRVAGEQFLVAYVLATATWLAWKSSKPF